MDHMVGAYGAITDATKETQDLCDQVKSNVENKTTKKYQEYKAVKYRNHFVGRLVTGTIYLIKVHVGGDDYIHLIIFQHLLPNTGKVSLTNVKSPQTKDSPLQPF
ncbi:cystatin-B-like [Perca fluviatilis]|uniref:cystatin-B-like n=1 Tax=Perca fluviatilis TaxID=8168 RepID=UPI00196690F8|nr:cystatin-B-like [Perca fluviatilis]